MNIRFNLCFFTLTLYSAVGYADIINLQRLSGDIGYMYGLTTSDSSSTVQTQNIRTSVNTRGYLWQPWFITTSVGGMVAFENRESDGGSNNRQLYSGNINFNALPLSRYPFKLSLTRTDSSLERTSDNLSALASGGASLDTHQSTDTLSIIQRYMSRRSSTEFSYRTADTVTDADDSSSLSYGLNYSYTMPHNVFNASATVNEASNNVANSTEGQSLRAAHRYSASGNVSVNTEATSTTSTYQQYDSVLAQLVTNETTIDQASSTLNYHSTDRKLSSNASIRAINLTQSSLGAVASKSTSSSTHFNVGNSYRFNNYLSGNLGGGLTQQESDGASASSSNQNLSLTTHSPTSKILSHDYSVNGSIGVSLSQDETHDDQQDNASLGHSIQRSFNLARRTNLRYSLSQAYSYSHTHFADELSESLSHSFNTSINHSMQSMRLGANLNYSTAQALNSNDSSDSTNISATLNKIINLNSSLNLSLTAHNYHAEYDGVISDTSGQQIKADYTYKKAFDYATMTFRSALSLVRNDSSTDTTETTYWSNNLAYVMGKLTSSLDYQIQDINGVGVSMLYINIRRRF